jgi:hypothetical protein
MIWVAMNGSPAAVILKPEETRARMIWESSRSSNMIWVAMVLHCEARRSTTNSTTVRGVICHARFVSGMILRRWNFYLEEISNFQQKSFRDPCIVLV